VGTGKWECGSRTKGPRKLSATRFTLKRALVRIRLSVQRYWLRRRARVGRNDHQSLAARSGHRPDVTDQRLYLHAVSPAASARAEPVCDASSSGGGCSGGPVPLVCAAGWLGLASGESASHRIADEGYKSAAVNAKASAARGHTASICARAPVPARKAHNTPAVCAAVSPCGVVLVSSTPPTVGGGGAGAPAVGYSMYSQWGTPQTHLL
jgi:hypothetical protein